MVFIDGSYVKAHQHSAGAGSGHDEAIHKSRSGNTCKIHLAVDAHSLPIEFEIPGGKINDCAQAHALISKRPGTETIVAHKGYDSESIQGQVERQGARAVIPERQRRYEQRSLPQSAPARKRFCPTEALPGCGVTLRQAQEKLRV